MIRIFLIAGVITAVVVGLFWAHTTELEPLTCRNIHLSTDRTFYANGETVKIHVEYVHLASGCGEVLLYHQHMIVVDANGVLVENWNTTSDSVRDIRWVPGSNGALESSITIRACEEAGQRLVLCSSSDAVVTSRPITQDIPPPSAALETATIAMVSLVVGLGVGLVFQRFRGK